MFEMCTFAVPFEARSMEELRFKVMKGKFPALPAVYSSDMQKMVRWLMIAEPSQRPDVDAVLDHPSVRRRAHLAPEPEPLVPEDAAGAGQSDEPGKPGAADQATAVTLGTIKVPKNLKMLKKRLPAPSYPSDHEKAAKERAAAAERADKEARLAAEAEDAAAARAEEEVRVAAEAAAAAKAEEARLAAEARQREQVAAALKSQAAKVQMQARLEKSVNFDEIYSGELGN